MLTYYKNYTYRTNRSYKKSNLNYLLHKFSKIYDLMKETNIFVNWIFDIIENSVQPYFANYENFFNFKEERKNVKITILTYY